MAEPAPLHPGRGRAASCAALLALFALLPGCAEPTREPKSLVSLPSTFSASGTAPLPEEWWRPFADEGLNALVAQSLAGNFTLKAAWNRLAQAQAAARKTGAAQWPTLDGSAGMTRTGREQALAAGTGTDRTFQTTYALGLSAGYEIDLWGRVRAAQDAASLQAEATAHDLRAAALSLSGQVASSWYSLIAQKQQRDLLQQQVDTNAKYLKLVEGRFRRGEVSATDVLQQRKLLASTRTEKADVQAAIETLEHRLAVLTGQVPGRATLPAGAALPTLPPLPATGVPAERMHNRPDVRAAFLRVRASDRSTAEAIANRFPRLSLAGSTSTSALKPSLLLEEWLASLAANLAAPLFDGGKRRAEVARSRAAAAENLHQYGQTLLAAVREVEDALSQEAQLEQTVRGLRHQLALSTGTVAQLVRSYRNGTVDFLRVLDELKTQQALQRRLLSARAQRLQQRIGLCLALGGGWDLQRPEADPTTEYGGFDQ